MWEYFSIQNVETQTKNLVISSIDTLKLLYFLNLFWKKKIMFKLYAFRLGF